MLVNQLSERNTNSFWLQKVDLQISKQSLDSFNGFTLKNGRPNGKGDSVGAHRGIRVFHIEF